jgi:hydrogenase 3 maturation protease
MDMEEAFDKLKKELAVRLHGVSPDRVVFVGVGNRLRGDDAIGPALIDLLKNRVPHAIDAGSAPENATSAVKRLKPRAVVFLDAAGLGDVPPGQARVVEAGDMEKLGASAHHISLDVVMEYLKEATGADVFLLGVQPERIGEGEHISPSLRRPLKELADAIACALKS